MDPHQNQDPNLTPPTPQSPPQPQPIPSNPLPPTPPVNPYAAQAPAVQPPAGPGPTAVVGNMDPMTGPVGQSQSVVPPPSPTGNSPLTGKKRSKKPFIFAALALLIIGGAAAFYFGYYANPSVIYTQSLKNTGKGYDKLIDYADAQNARKYKGYTGTGSYKFIQTGGATSDGKINLHGDDKNLELTFDVGLAATRVNADMRAITTSGSDIPDIYVKAQGVKGLGSLAGYPETDSAVNSLDNQWIVIDHNLIESLDAQAGATETVKPPTQAQILDEMRAFGKVNQDYLFSTSKDKGLTQIVKSHGTETINGHKTYHYTVALQKDNVKKYITAQRDALKQSKLYAWIKDNDYDKMVDNYYDEIQGSVGSISSESDFDIWADASKHIIYKIRVDGSKNPAKEFVDVGLDYKGGDSYPFFISGQSKESGVTDTFSFTSTLNTKTPSVDFKVTFNEDGRTGGSVVANFTYKPTNTVTPVVKPASAKQVSEVLSQFGLGGLLNELQNPTTSFDDSALPDGALFQ